MIVGWASSMNRVATEQDRKEILPLWNSTFGDEESFIQWAMEEYAGFEHVYVAKAEEQVAAFLLAVPCSCNNSKGIYMFALATNPVFQKQGMMTSLMEYAQAEEQSKGAKFAALIPATQPLYQFYEKRGYGQTLHVRQVGREISANLFASARFDTVTANRLGVLREKFLQEPFVRFSQQQLGGILQDLYSSGAETAETENGYAIYFYNRNALAIAEMGAVTGMETELLQAIREKTGHTKATITVSDNSNLFLGEGTLQPMAMIKSFEDGLPLEKAYLRFAFEEITK